MDCILRHKLSPLHNMSPLGMTICAWADATICHQLAFGIKLMAMNGITETSLGTADQMYRVGRGVGGGGGRVRRDVG